MPLAVAVAHWLYIYISNIYIYTFCLATCYQGPSQFLPRAHRNHLLERSFTLVPTIFFEYSMNCRSVQWTMDWRYLAYISAKTDCGSWSVNEVDSTSQHCPGRQKKRLYCALEIWCQGSVSWCQFSCVLNLRSSSMAEQQLLCGVKAFCNPICRTSVLHWIAKDHDPTQNM